MTRVWISLAGAALAVKIFIFGFGFVVNERSSSVAMRHGAAVELTQERIGALARIDLAEAGRGVAAVRQTSTHFVREDPIAWFGLAEK